MSCFWDGVSTHLQRGKERKKSLCIATLTATVQSSWQGRSSWSQTTARKRKPFRLAGSEWTKEESQWPRHLGYHMELKSVLWCRFYKNFWVKLCLLFPTYLFPSKMKRRRNEERESLTANRCNIICSSLGSWCSDQANNLEEVIQQRGILFSRAYRSRLPARW